MVWECEEGENMGMVCRQPEEGNCCHGKSNMWMIAGVGCGIKRGV